MRKHTHGPRIMPKVVMDQDIEELHIYPIGDLHYGNSFQDRDFVKEVINTIKEDDNAYWLGCGDYFEMNGKKQPHSGVYGQTLQPEQQLEAFVEDFTPIADKCLTLIDGNHDYRITKDWGVSPTKWTATEMGLRDVYVEDGALVRIQFGSIRRKGGRRETGGGKQCGYTLYVTHGLSGSATTSGKVTALQKAGDVVVADVIVGAHVHSEIVFRDRIYVPTMHDKIQSSFRDRWYVNTGSFLNYGGYALTARYRPQPIACPVIVLDGTREKVGIKM